MTSPTIPAPLRTKRWTLTVDLFEEGDDTRAHAVLETPERTLEGNGSSHRNPHDTEIADIGDEYAAGRALVELGRQLLRAGAVDAAAEEDGRFG
ncbi:dsRBD fold-containing protein [Streptacidiphilus neutrinimicus]|uniref:dsRBD fold-containing protein n=1 Tax=Streptacidiphilus neutrinimicus TaxID=105420 RepID=UPI0005A95691|nr:dsRBD fold-containing protein [Streptacidiphilus neutrinimicus]